MEAIEKKMPRAFSNVGEAKYLFSTNQIVSYLESRGATTRSNLLRHFYKDIDGEAFEIIIDTLKRMRLITDHRLQSGDMLYELVSPEQLLKEAEEVRYGEEKDEESGAGETTQPSGGHAEASDGESNDHGGTEGLDDGRASEAR
jgi:hypothetical protein